MPENTSSSKGKKIIKRILLVLYAIVAVAFLFMGFVVRYLLETWSDLSPDEIIYHLFAPLEGTDPSIVITGFVRYGIVTIIILVTMIIIHRMLAGDKRTFRRLVIFSLVSSISISAVSLYDFDRKTGLFGYIAYSLDPDHNDFISQNYVDPQGVDVVFPKEKRNLIYIFLESMEVTYMDKKVGGAFKDNVIPELTDIALENGSFSGDEKIVNGAVSPPGTNWTVAGMFAQTSGLPLKLPLGGNFMTYEEEFFPEIVTMGDMLKAEGYHNTLLVGSDAVFGGRQALFEGHGDFDIHDYGYMVSSGRLPEDYRVFWGFEDERLLNYAREDLETISKKDEPFCYTLLTVDTHFEDGYICDICEENFEDNQYANVFSCASRQIDSFISWIQEQDFYENTTIVIAGDHTTMDSDFCENVGNDYLRRAYYTIINPADNLSQDKKREYSVLDSFPTTLAAMGCTIPGDRLGLGTNLYSNTPTLTETFGVDAYEMGLAAPSNFFDEYEAAQISDDKLDRIRDALTLIWYEHEGEYRIDIDGISAISNPYEIEDGYLLVTFPDGREEKYELIIDIKDKYNMRGYKYYADIDLTREELEGASVKAFCTLKDWEDILLVGDLLDEGSFRNPAAPAGDYGDT